MPKIRPPFNTSQQTLVAVVVAAALTTQHTTAEVYLAGGRVLFQPDAPDTDYVFVGRPGGFQSNYVGPALAAHPVITPRCELLTY